MKLKITVTVLTALGLSTLIYAFGPQGEPAPQTSTVKPPQEKPYRLKNGDIRLGELTLHRKQNEISFSGYLNKPTLGTLEVLLVNQSPRGRAHEGLVVTDASPFQLEVLLYLLGAKNDIPRQGQNKKGSIIDIDIEWRDDNGQIHRDPIEKWVVDMRTGKTMQRQGFYFVGSSFSNDIYQAEGNGNLCLLYSNTSATVLDPVEKDSGNDALYETNPAALNPGAFKPIRLILSIRKER